MQAVILAGGLGTRLGDLTKEFPKPMMDVAGKPFLYHQIMMLKKHGMKDILLCVGYLGNKIEEFFGDGSHYGVKILYSYEDKLLGTGGAIKNAENLIQDEFIVLNGDTYLDMDYEGLIKFFHESDVNGVLVVSKSADKTITNVEINSEDDVIQYEKGNGGQFSLVDSGVQIFKKNILNIMNVGKKFSLEKEIFLKLISNKQLKAFLTDKMFYDIGTPERLNIFIEYLNKR